MKEKLKTLFTNKFFLVTAISTLIVVILGVTYAWLTWQSEENTNFTLSIGEVGTAIFAGGNEISATGLGPVLTEAEGEITEFQILKKTDDSFTVTIDFLPSTLPEELKEESFKYKLYSKESENGTYSLVSEGNFADKTQGTQFNIASAEITATTYYKLVIYIDGNLTNPDDMKGQDFAGTVIVSYEEAMSNVVLSTYITDTYNNATKTPVTNNSISYSYATSESLMADTAGNIRYYGGKPNNYIYFNCDDYSAQTEDTCELWRIIGVFDGLVKIVRNESIGKHPWDSNTGIYYDYSYHYGSNQWGNYSGYNGASLMRILNPGYESNSANNSLYYTRQKGNCYTQGTEVYECDFSTTGLKNDTTKNMIQSTTYYTAGYNNVNIYSNQMYTYERGSLVGSSTYDSITRKTSWAGLIALPYPSDYGYAADLSACTVNLETYDDANCTENNWMYSMKGDSNTMWFMNPKSGSEQNVISVYSSGEVYPYYACNSMLNIFPTLHIGSDVVVKGKGTDTKPYQIQLS